MDITKHINTIIVIVVGVFTGFGTWIRMNMRINNIQKDVIGIREIVYKDHGELNFITPDRCLQGQIVCQKLVISKVEEIKEETKDIKTNVKELTAEVSEIKLILNSLSVIISKNRDKV